MGGEGLKTGELEGGLPIFVVKFGETSFGDQLGLWAIENMKGIELSNNEFIRTGKYVVWEDGIGFIPALIDHSDGARKVSLNKGSDCGGGVARIQVAGGILSVALSPMMSMTISSELGISKENQLIFVQSVLGELRKLGFDMGSFE